MWRKFVYNNLNLKPRRRQLRNRATESEILLWNKLRRKQLGFKFVRQYSVGGYVIDFYASGIRLAIEVDGEYHLNYNQTVYDKYRTRYLAAADISEIRFKNAEITNDIEEVVSKIKAALPS